MDIDIGHRHRFIQMSFCTALCNTVPYESGGWDLLPIDNPNIVSRRMINSKSWHNKSLDK